MERGLYIAASGMLAEQVRHRLHARTGARDRAAISRHRGRGLLRGADRPRTPLHPQRDGSLQVDGAGRLVTGSGVQLRPPVTVPAGTPESAISIGTVTAAGRQGGRLQLDKSADQSA